MIRSLMCAVAALSILSGCSDSDAPPVGAPVFKRLTESQYRQVIADTFGEHIVVAGTFEPIAREDGMVAIGAAKSAITPIGLERFDGIARSIAHQVMAPQHRKTLIPCQPKAVVDDACASAFLARAGEQLFRRPLTAPELAAYVKGAAAAAANLDDFYDGLGESLAGMMVAPAFLYIADFTEPEPERPGALRLTAHAIASRLSFTLWNSGPDEELLRATAAGELHQETGLQRQVDRMLASPRVEAGIRAFFADMLAFERFQTLEKDTQIYATFSRVAGADAGEQILRTLIDRLVTRSEPYPDVFKTRETYMSPELSRLYRVQALHPTDWTEFAFAESDHRAGIQSLVGFVALHSHPGRSSPTIRGKAVRELLLCQRIPDPPGDVDFTLFNDPAGPGNTARERLDIHNKTPTCAGCHKIMDPIGLAMENFDGAGEYRAADNGVVLDTSGDLDGRAFTDIGEFADALAENPAVTTCVANRVFAYAAGRNARAEDKAFMQAVEKRFANEGYRIRALLRAILANKAFYRIADEKEKVTS